MKILAIETSCDETSAAVVDNGPSTSLGTSIKVLSNIVSSQVDFHRKYGGIVPEIASRKHAELINPVIAEALEQAKIKSKEVDAIAVTYGPGLPGALLVGICAAKALSYSLNIPIISVNHIVGHIYANFIAGKPKFPFICLVVSGGHTELILVKGHGSYESIGRTRDDAAGEAFDKVARYLGLGYPGGPIIDQMSKDGDPTAIDFPRGMMNGNYDFSFSGLKTAVVYYVKKNPDYRSVIGINNLVASFQAAIVDVLIDKTLKAAQEYKCNTIALAGGVSANSKLRDDMKQKGEGAELEVLIPEMKYCTDNAVMIAVAGYYLSQGMKLDKGMDMVIVPNLRI
ncbi:MAG: tRNA (adenosine(37)-N6)-threonylcarbamoyltransferase complex transferase subunit TsaD [bacterium]